MIRGYCILRGLSFIDDQFGSHEGERIKGRLSEAFQGAIVDLTPGEWCPRECYVELMHVIAGAKSDPEEVEAALVRCGESMAIEAHGTFLKLAINVMTPRLFAKKLPTMWDLNHKSSGELEIDASGASDGRFTLRLVGVGGYDHVALAYLGWIRRGLAKVGAAGARVAQHGWTPSSPGPDTVTYEVVLS